ncbi:YdiU family protein [Sphingobium sp. DEHP117]|uniref:protein adenylyltransferase SelO family protein n=1 Tax=Sphingobium sp. DEHP117 TaxID=2993436 RepID=UPI0027D61C1B|nr:YdiU family protein [Sphingobium sp. DEHP117]MDQ4419936.1 YdiU family protein [Sphingobium sp. DEHP117]
MILTPQPAKFTPARDILDVPSLGDAVAPATFPQHILRYRNDRWAQSVGLGELGDAEWVNHFGRFAPLAGSLERPLALRYHGHQFRVYNPDIGDGRGFLFAQMRDHLGRLMDLGTKGSGQTPYSRFGDGRLTLKGGVREILATEMLEALGVYTSRSFSLIETGEALERNDEPSPTRAAVLVRLSHSHIRIGSFQRAATLHDEGLLKALTDYALTKLYDATPGENPAAQLLGLVVERTADLAASYMIAGFVHGVLNSDNINITGESFDYGPWRFTPLWEPGFTAAYFDHQGLYAFARQAEAIHWDVAQLALSLRTLSETEPLVDALNRFPELYAAAMRRRFCWRLGIAEGDADTTSALIESAVRAMIESKTPIDRFFFDWRGGVLRTPTSEQHYTGPVWAELKGNVASFANPAAASHIYWHGEAPCSMHIDEVEAIWAAIDTRDDWTMLEAKIAQIADLREAMSGP